MVESLAQSGRLRTLIHPGPVYGVHVRLYVYGYVQYIDAFKYPRFTNFCLAISGSPGNILDVAYCDQHNDST
jgi:hypothetical protein